MPITFDSGTNTITVTGYTETSPCTFEDIYQADQNNSWGVVSKQDDIQYTIDAKLRIGDGSTETWFKDINKHVVVTPSTNDVFYVDNNAVFQLGEKDANGHLFNGCDFRVPNYEGDSAFYGYDNGAWRLYDCIIYYPTFLYLWSRGLVPPTHEIIGCRFLKFMGMRIAGGNSIFKENVIHSHDATWSMYGLSFKGEIQETSDIYAYKLKYGVYWSPLWGTGNLVVSRFKVRDCQYAIRVVGESAGYTMYIVDTDVDAWHISWENMSTDANKIYRRYTFQVGVTDANSNPVDGAVVEVWDKYNNKVVTAMTGSDGKIPAQLVTYGYYAYPTGDTLNSYSPHRVRVTKSGYKTVEFEMEMNRPLDLVIALNAELHSIDDVLTELQDHRNAVESNIDATISSRASESTVQLVKSQTDKLQFDTSNNVQARVNDKGVLNDPSADEIADTVWDEVTSDHTSSGSFGEEVQSHATPSEVKAQADQSLADYDPPTKAELDQAEANIRGVDSDSLKTLSDQIDSVKEQTDKISTIQLDVSFIKDIEGGRWVRDGHQMIFYKDDNITEIARFDLYKKDGNLAEEDEDVFERRRI